MSLQLKGTVKTLELPVNNINTTVVYENVYY